MISNELSDSLKTNECKAKAVDVVAILCSDFRNSHEILHPWFLEST